MPHAPLLCSMPCVCDKPSGRVLHFSDALLGRDALPGCPATASQATLR